MKESYNIYMKKILILTIFTLAFVGQNAFASYQLKIVDGLQTLTFLTNGTTEYQPWNEGANWARAEQEITGNGWWNFSATDANKVHLVTLSRQVINWVEDEPEEPAQTRSSLFGSNVEDSTSSSTGATYSQLALVSGSILDYVKNWVNVSVAFPILLFMLLGIIQMFAIKKGKRLRNEK
jgi:hypothetical protein